MHGKIMEFENKMNNRGKIMEFCEIIWRNHQNPENQLSDTHVFLLCLTASFQATGGFKF